jgi:hypothetical protein
VSTGRSGFQQRAAGGGASLLIISAFAGAAFNPDLAGIIAVDARNYQ